MVRWRAVVAVVAVVALAVPILLFDAAPV